MRLLCSNSNITVQWPKYVQILLYIAKIISLYASSRPNLNFDGYLTFESTFKALKPVVLFLFQLMQVASFGRWVTQFRNLLFTCCFCILTWQLHSPSFYYYFFWIFYYILFLGFLQIHINIRRVQIYLPLLSVLKPPWPLQ